MKLLERSRLDTYYKIYTVSSPFSVYTTTPNTYIKSTGIKRCWSEIYDGDQAGKHGKWGDGKEIGSF